MICTIKSSLKIEQKTKITFLFRLLFFFKQKYVFYSWKCISFKIPKNLIDSGYMDTLKNMDMPLTWNYLQDKLTEDNFLCL